MPVPGLVPAGELGRCLVPPCVLIGRSTKADMRHGAALNALGIWDNSVKHSEWYRKARWTKQLTGTSKYKVENINNPKGKK